MILLKLYKLGDLRDFKEGNLKIPGSRFKMKGYNNETPKLKIVFFINIV